MRCDRLLLQLIARPKASSQRGSGKRWSHRAEGAGPWIRPRGRLRRLLLTRKGESPGFIVMMMLILLTLVLGSVAIAARSGDSLQSAANQASNRDARDVAESGLAEIISELNKVQNRRILVSGVDYGSWAQGTATSTNLLYNPCTDPTGTGGSPPTATAAGFNNSNWRSLAGSSTRQYRLMGVSFSYTDRSAYPTNTLSTGTIPATVIAGTTKTLIRLTVEGQVLNSTNTAISRARLIKEYEVVPKCCRLSFGYNTSGATTYGEDNRTCSANGYAGLIASLEGGAINSSGNTLNITDQTGALVTKMLCNRNQGNTSCDNGTLTLGSSISVVPITFSVTQPPWPTALDSSFDDNDTFQCLTTSGLANYTNPSTASCVGGNNTDLVVRVNSSNNVESCQVSSGVLGTCTTINAPTCRELTSGTKPGFYCRFSLIDASKGIISFDTSRKNLYIYFDKPSATGLSSKKFIDTGSNAQRIVQQVYCSTPPADTALCATGATLASVERLNFYGYGSSSIDLQGSGAALVLNIFSPYSSVTMKGNGTFTGRLWVNAFTITGNTTMKVPNTLPGQFCNSTTCPPNTGGTPGIDWIARSVSYASAF